MGLTAVGVMYAVFLAPGWSAARKVKHGSADDLLVAGRAMRLWLATLDAYQDPRFNRDVDLKTGFRTRSVLCLPLHDRSGDVFAVTQLLNRRDGAPFDAADEKRYADFAASLGVLLESLVEIDRAPAS